MSFSVASRFTALRDYAGNLAWSPLVQFSRSKCLALLQLIKLGTLEITDSDGKVVMCGEGATAPGGYSEPYCSLRVHKEIFWVRLVFFTDLGFAESYLLSEISSPNLMNFFKIFILNRSHLHSGTTITSALSTKLTSILRATNTLANARLNIAAHYDISNDMFAAFLSPDMTYSCPIWLPKTNRRSAKERLQEAQERKLSRFIENTRIKGTDRVLEIGTGWGSFAIKAVRETGCSIVSLTLSVEQKEAAEKRIEEAGLSNKIEVRICDYRDMEVPEEGPFDKIVSIEMLEAVGKEYLNTYFGCVDKLLKKDGGIAAFQCITIPEARYEAYSQGDDFIRRYIFPGGHLPSVSQLVASIAAGSDGSLIVDDIENIGPHYAKTLRIWNETFMNNFDEIIKPALSKQHEDMNDSDFEVFKRKWEYYFTYCEASFATKTLGDVIITVGREGAMEMLEDVPL